MRISDGGNAFKPVEAQVNRTQAVNDQPRAMKPIAGRVATNWSRPVASAIRKRK